MASVGGEPLTGAAGRASRRVTDRARVSPAGAGTVAVRSDVGPGPAGRLASVAPTGAGRPAGRPRRALDRGGREPALGPVRPLGPGTARRRRTAGPGRALGDQRRACRSRWRVGQRGRWPGRSRRRSGGCRRYRLGRCGRVGRCRAGGPGRSRGRGTGRCRIGTTGPGRPRRRRAGRGRFGPAGPGRPYRRHAGRRLGPAGPGRPHRRHAGRRRIGPPGPGGPRGRRAGGVGPAGPGRTVGASGRWSPGPRPGRPVSRRCAGRRRTTRPGRPVSGRTAGRRRATGPGRTVGRRPAGRFGGAFRGGLGFAPDGFVRPGRIGAHRLVRAGRPRRAPARTAGGVRRPSPAPDSSRAAGPAGSSSWRDQGGAHPPPQLGRFQLGPDQSGSMADDSPARCVSPGRCGSPLRCASPARCVSAGREPSAARPGSPSSADAAGPGVRPEDAAGSGASGSRQSRGAVGLSSAASRSPVGAWKPGGTSKPDAAVPTGGTWTAGGAEVGNPGSAQRARCAAAGSTVECGAGPGSGSTAPCSAGGAGRWAGTTQPVAGRPRAALGGQPGRGAHRRGASRGRFETGVVDAVDVIRVVHAVDVVAVGAGRRLGVARPPGQRRRQVAVPCRGGPPARRGVGLPARRLIPGVLAVGGSRPPTRRRCPPTDGTARVVVLTRSVTVLSRGGGSGLPCFTHRALLGRPR